MCDFQYIYAVTSGSPSIYGLTNRLLKIMLEICTVEDILGLIGSEHIWTYLRYLWFYPYKVIILDGNSEHVTQVGRKTFFSIRFVTAPYRNKCRKQIRKPLSLDTARAPISEWPSNISTMDPPVKTWIRPAPIFLF